MREQLSESVKKHEGFQNKAYRDSLGVLTIGYGFNLERPDAKEILAKVGAELEPVRSGVQTLTESQCLAILEFCIEESLGYVEKLVPNWNDLPGQCRIVLAEMVFQLGPSKFAKFKQMLAAIARLDYHKAAVEMLDSMWALQCPARAGELARRMRKC